MNKTLAAALAAVASFAPLAAHAEPDGGSAAYIGGQILGYIVLGVIAYFVWKTFLKKK
jgi:hypothetical protein